MKVLNYSVLNKRRNALNLVRFCLENSFCQKYYRLVGICQLSFMSCFNCLLKFREILLTILNELKAVDFLYLNFIFVMKTSQNKIY